MGALVGPAPLPPPLRLRRPGGLFLSVLLLSILPLAPTDQPQGEEAEECGRDGPCGHPPQGVNGNWPKKSPSPHHMYSKGANEKWNKILEEVAAAEKAYGRREEGKPFSEGDCSLYESLIDKDLSIFSGGITLDMVNGARSRGTLYQVVGGRLYREKLCRFPARCSGIEHFLLKIAKELPDTEFVVNPSDWPQVSSHFPDPLPVFSFSKNADYADITYPAWAFWDGGPSIPIYPKGVGRWDVLRKALISASKKYPWDKKESKAFFRGSRTSSERDALVYLSRKHSDLVDAKYTKNQAWKSDADTLNAPAAKEVAFEDHCKFKYLFNYRGVAASFRFKHLFLCNSLVFHVGNEWIEFFYPELKPWVHYIPVDPQATEDELRSIIEFAKENDEIAERIAKRGYDFIKTNLKMKHISCYWRHLLLKYSQLVKYAIKKREEVVIL